ncbi:hypothetical protein N1027_03890 [Herbiconiux sp. CPCC 205763]|uniref:Lipoprotein n=1 Tax=Herbiconiux aconitum TaxID=2970913 RepID=A0ABT2GM36_9MICO|nr:hypothetical protein [Herbiconiux aconitum]MCS5717273.1 hypothetical protein [Herbiconiux aconitum]
MSRNTMRLLIAGAVALTLAATVSGCVGSGSAAPGTPAATPVASTPTPSPMPVEEVVALDPLAEPLVGAGHALVAGSEGFAPVEARTQLDMATATLETDVLVVQTSMAGGPAASQASPPVDEARITADIAALFAAAQSVRQGVVETAIRVVNDEAPDADPALRDDLYLAIVAQQSQAVATDDTPRQVLELVAKVRAAQDSQAAYVAEQARQAASSGGGDGGGSGGSGSSMPIPVFPSIPEFDICDWGRGLTWPICHQDPTTLEMICAEELRFPQCG